MTIYDGHLKITATGTMHIFLKDANQLPIGG